MFFFTDILMVFEATFQSQGAIQGILGSIVTELINKFKLSSLIFIYPSLWVFRPISHWTQAVSPTSKMILNVRMLFPRLIKTGPSHRQFKFGYGWQNSLTLFKEFWSSELGYTNIRDNLNCFTGIL